MKPRRVLVELEIETDMDLKTLRDKEYWMDHLLDGESPYIAVEQVLVNVIKK